MLNGSDIEVLEHVDLSWKEWALLENNRCNRWKSVDGHCTNTSFVHDSPVQCDEFVYEKLNSFVAEVGLTIVVIKSFPV